MKCLQSGGGRETFIKPHKYWVMMAAAAVFIQALRAHGDAATNLPGPEIFGLVVVGIVAAVGIARWRK